MNIRQNKNYHSACNRIQVTFDPNSNGVAGTLDIREDFYLEILDNLGVLSEGHNLVDLAAGFSRFSPMARLLGMDVTIIDDFGGGGGIDPAERQSTESTIKCLKDNLGLKIITQNFISDPVLPLPSESVDVLTCFHSLEHWHHSPKRLFAEIRRVIKRGGYAVFATPNAVNLRKRAWVLFGRSNLPRLEDWYNQEPEWRGHVREPILSDLQNIFRWNGFRIHSSFGRNFYARDSLSLQFIPRRLRHLLTNGSGQILKYFPTLCSDIHVVAQKP